MILNVLMQCEVLGQLCNDPRARAAVLADMDAIGKEAQVSYLKFYAVLAVRLHLLRFLKNFSDNS